jgi:hypothetical protein
MLKSWKTVVVISLVCALATLCLGCETLKNKSTSAPASPFKVIETSLGKFNKMPDPPPVLSPDLRHIAWVVRDGDKHSIVVDGTKIYTYYQIHDVVFSADAKRIAFVARRERGNYMSMAVVDGIEGKECGTVYDLVFSPDSKRFAYVAQRGNKYVAVVDGIEGKEYDQIGEEPGYVDDDRNSIAFSHDSKHVAYAARNNDKWVIVTDGVEVKEGTGPSGLVFSPDSKRIAHEGSVFSPDSMRLACVGLNGNKRLVIVDGAKGKEYDLIYSLVFSPDSRRLAYAVYDPSRNRGHIVVDSMEDKEYQVVDGPVFSADSKHVAYIAVDEKVFLVVDGVPCKEYTNVEMPKQLIDVVVGDDPWIPAFGPAFSSDFNHIAYTIKHDKKAFIVVDGIEVEQYEGIPGKGYLVFDSPTKLHTIIRRNNEYILVTIEITE